MPVPRHTDEEKAEGDEAGEVLEVLTDYPLSLERIPRNVEKEGHKVLSLEKIGDGPDHKILIQVGSQ